MIANLRLDSNVQVIPCWSLIDRLLDQLIDWSIDWLNLIFLSISFPRARKPVWWRILLAHHGCTSSSRSPSPSTLSFSVCTESSAPLRIHSGNLWVFLRQKCGFSDYFFKRLIIFLESGIIHFLRLFFSCLSGKGDIVEWVEARTAGLDIRHEEYNTEWSIAPESHLRRVSLSSWIPVRFCN